MSRRLGRFTVVATLGAGAMGEVFRAHDARLGRDVAIKTVRNVFGVSGELFRARFEAEARALAALSHPAIVQVHDLGIEDETSDPYLVMELVDGPSLKQRLERGPMPAAEVRALGIQLARALEAAHARGILHRDVKPANVLLAPTGQWKLADFGVAHVPDSSMTMTGQFLGTPAYAAPEAVVLGQFSAQSDVFSLAALMIEAVTGERLRGDASLSEIVQRSGDSIPLPAGIPPELADPLRVGLARDPKARPTAAQFADLLAGASSTPSLATAAISSPGTMLTGAPPRRRTAQIVGAVAGLAVLIGIVAALASRGGGDAPAAAGTPSASPRPSPSQGREARAAEQPPPTEPPSIAPVVTRDPKHAEKRWYKFVDKVQEGKLDDALEKLDEFERHHGSSEATRQWRAYLSQFAGGYEDED